MTAFQSKPRMGALRLASTIAMAGVALVYREAIRMLDERAGRLLARPTSDRGGFKPGSVGER